MLICTNEVAATSGVGVRQFFRKNSNCPKSARENRGLSDGQHSLFLTVIADPTSPGSWRRLSRRPWPRHGGSWQNSHMARLAGLLRGHPGGPGRGPRRRRPRSSRSCTSLEARGLRVKVADSATTSERGRSASAFPRAPARTRGAGPAGHHPGDLERPWPRHRRECRSSWPRTCSSAADDGRECCFTLAPELRITLLHRSPVEELRETLEKIASASSMVDVAVERIDRLSVRRDSRVTSSGAAHAHACGGRGLNGGAGSSAPERDEFVSTKPVLPNSSEARPVPCFPLHSMSASPGSKVVEKDRSISIARVLR